MQGIRKSWLYARAECKESLWAECMKCKEMSSQAQESNLHESMDEAGILHQVEEFDLMADAAGCEEIKEVNENCILMENLQQASTLGTLADEAPVYDLEGLAELLESTTEPHLVQLDDNNVFPMDSSMDPSG
ncbi:hypothetical protein Tco_0800879 [Tanacetum coccineum]|uniref:Uncharacterized protein n=1 Tax=Tanacetum coccineum TaxID=301880 RepID=A0ABQ4ZWR1_9ASTR